MNAHGPHLHQPAFPRDFQHEGPCATIGRRTETTPVSLPGWYCSRAWRHCFAHQRTQRSRAYASAASSQDHCFRNRRQGEGELQRLGSSRIFRKMGIRVADRLRGIHGEPFAKTIGVGLHRELRRTSSPAFIPGGINCLPQEARNPIRRAIYF